MSDPPDLTSKMAEARFGTGVNIVLYYSPSLHTSASVGRKLSKTDKRDQSDCELCAQVAMM